MPGQDPSELCVECQQRDARLQIRNRRLCADCFTRYVNSKVLKRMESYRFKNLDGNQKRRLFLPVSAGISSLVLLYILDTQLQRQIANRNRTAYDLVIACVVPYDQTDTASIREWYAQLESRLSSHKFLPVVDLHASLMLDRSLENDLRQLDYHRQNDESDSAFFARLLGSTASVTTAADLRSILLRRLLVAMAKEQNCESILWGHSDSRLAAMSLADVAKGRGGSVPSTIADGPSPFGISFNYPVRDLFKTELYTYASVLPEHLFEATGDIEQITQTSTLRNTAIDTLLSEYINSQGEKYPSIMANVVRTASKLEARSATHSCKLCVQPILDRRESPLLDNRQLCYGCQRMKQDISPST